MDRNDQEKHKKENMEKHFTKTTNQLDIALQCISTLEALACLTTDKTVTSTTTSTIIVIELSIKMVSKISCYGNDNYIK